MLPCRRGLSALHFLLSPNLSQQNLDGGRNGPVAIQVKLSADSSAPTGGHCSDSNLLAKIPQGPPPGPPPGPRQGPLQLPP